MTFNSRKILLSALSILIFIGNACTVLSVNIRNKRLIDPNAKIDPYQDYIKDQVMLVDENNWPYCGGTIIGVRFILTAAHCVIDKATNDFVKKPVIILAGTNTLHESDRKNRIYRYVEEIIVHKNYVRSVRGYDFAILRLNPGLYYESGVKVMNLPSIQDNYDNVIAEVSGIGVEKLEYNPSIRAMIEYNPTDLRYQNVHVLSQKRCREIWGEVFRPYQLCGRLDGPFTRRGICNGDSGSGLIYDGKIIGVVSYGRSCNEGPNGRPTIYTKVANFSKFITDVMDKHRYEYMRTRFYNLNEKFTYRRGSSGSTV